MVNEINSSASLGQNNINYKETKTQYKDIIIEKIKEKETKKPEKEEKIILVKDKIPEKEMSTTTVVEISKIEKNIPEKKYTPFEITKRTEYAFSAIFVIALFISLLNFPFTSFMNWDGVSDVTFSIGWPMKFFEVSLNKPEGNPIKFVGLIVDISLYIIMAYLIDVITGFFMRTTKKRSVEIDKAYNYKKVENINSKENFQPIKKSSEEIISAAKKAYEYYQKKGLKEEEIIKLFKNKGWKEEDIKKLK